MIVNHTQVRRGDAARRVSTKQQPRNHTATVGAVLKPVPCVSVAAIVAVGARRALPLQQPPPRNHTATCRDVARHVSACPCRSHLYRIFSHDLQDEYSE
jgi:hypothetical protein